MWRGLSFSYAPNNLIGATKTRSGLKIKTSIDENIYEKGVKVSDEELQKINIEKDEFHGE